MISLSCPSCQTKFEVKDRLAGNNSRCPRCKQAVAIPADTLASERAHRCQPSFAEDAANPPQPTLLTDEAMVSPRPLEATVTSLGSRAARNSDVAKNAPRESLKAESNYEVEGEIARGGMGAIMRAVDQDIQREVAVKFLLDPSDAKWKARFVEEAQITGQLEHPNIVPIHQLGVHQDGRCFFSMKMVKGRSLAEILAWKLVKRNKGASITAAAALVVLTVIAGIFLKINYDARVLAEDERNNAQEQRGKAEDAYQAYLDQVKGSVPLLLRAAKAALGERQFDDALVQASVAVQSAPDNVEARLLKGQLLITRIRFAEAASELQEYRKLKGEDAGVQSLTELCRKAEPNDVKSLMSFAEVFTQRGEHALADGVMSGEGKTALEARQRILEARQRQLEIYRQRIEAAWPGQGDKVTMSKDGLYSLKRLEKVTDLAPLRGMQLTALDLRDNDQLRDLEPLRGMPLTSLGLYYCTQIQDLAPLKGMPLTSLGLAGTRVRDLAPLKGMSLTTLSLYRCRAIDKLEPLQGMPLARLNLRQCSQVRNLEPLKGMPLIDLNLGTTQVRDLELLKGLSLNKLMIFNTGVTDLNPLQGRELEDIRLTPKNITQGLDILRDMESLTTIGISQLPTQAWPADEFWERYDRGEFK